MSAKNETRYPGAAPLAFDRQQPISPQERRFARTPSPDPSGSYSPHDRYAAARPGHTYRGGYSNGHRSDTWRQSERSYYSTPYSGQINGDRYPPSRNGEQDSWPRPGWRSPDAQHWIDRRPPSLYENGWSRVRRDTMAQAMFEPSDNWKQNHGLPSDYQEGTIQDRGYDRYSGLSPRELTPERSGRSAVPQPYSPTERFRRYPPAQEYREQYPYSYNRSDSYRSYQERATWNSTHYPSEEYPGGFEFTSRTIQNNTRFPGRNRRRQRTVSSGSFHDGTSSPIRTRTNLPDRLDSTSRFNSEYSPRSPLMKRTELYSVSPIARTHSRSRSTSHSPRFAQERVQGTNLPSEDARNSIRFDLETMRVTAHERNSMDEHRDVISLTDAYNPTQSTSLSINAVSHRPTDESRDDMLVDQAADINPGHETGFPSHPMETTSRVPTSEALPSSISPKAPLPVELRWRDEGQEMSPEPDIPLAIQHRKAGAHPSASIEHEYSAESDRLADENSLPEVLDADPIPLQEALRMVVAMRLQHDHQSKEERVDPILRDNLSKVGPLPPPISTSPEAVVKEVTSGQCLRVIQASFQATQPSLQVRFAQRQADLNEKVERLKKEYLTLHEQWLAQCNKLDEVARNLALQEAAATAGRTTRRSAATLGDAVRSDLEMEQIIASLGNEELTDATHLGARNAAKIPDMISVTTGEVEYCYDDTNNEVENPAEFYVPHTRVEDWTDEEITILVEKFAEFPKQFGIIADFLPNKTTAECIAFYYLHKHKHIDFRKVVARRAASKRRRGGRKHKSNALLADIMKHDEEVNADNTGSGKRKKTVPLPGSEPRRGRRGATYTAQTPTETSTPEPDADPKKRRRRIATRPVASSLQEENQEEGDADEKPAKRTRRARKPRTSSMTPATAPIVPEDPSSILGTRFIDQTELISRRKPPASANWTDEDKALFLQLLAQYGHDFKSIAASMPNKTTIQVSTFYKANAISMDLDQIARRVSERSLSPEHYSMNWDEAAHASNSGSVTPCASFSNTPTPADPYSGINYTSYPFDTPFRMNASMQPSPFSPFGTSYAHMPSSSVASTQSHFYSSMDTGAQYGASVDARSRPYIPIQPRGDQYVSIGGRFNSDGSTPILGLSSKSSHYHPPTAAPATLRTTFQSAFPYSSLSPASFAARGSMVRGSGSGGIGGQTLRSLDADNQTMNGSEASMASMSSSSIAFDASPTFVPPPQAWTHAPLQTTEDLAAYLEHRTRLASGQQR